ncbi:two-component system capsular synthesis response regulator RcsB [Luteibacter jiangsuensis]|uniref:Two-component system capsular synthesis response regulator RcsB n=1 Tax=Luteibacter jiangsuensis TaxID=637577 RepID=A0ABT9STC6_9GAMM|nr:response regulator transcription factor [Luteibacter jiangsuensis]MDQ0008251.1 two-component system capsular synthesis response regulator RcsB [Luteibacter jiangsuensis]
MRVIISDDHPVVLMGLKAALQSYGDRFSIIGEASNGRELASLLSREPCDLLITDFSMPGDQPSEDGLSMLAGIRENYPKLSILVLTMLRNPALVQGMLAIGVGGVVDKMAMTRELILAIDVICAGRIYLSERTRKQIEETAIANNEPGSISPREAEVVRFLAQGLTVSEIARRTGRSVKTVSQQKRDAMRKLGLDGDKQLYDYARSNGLF